MIGTAVTRPAGPGVEAIDDVRSALVADIVAGDLVGPITRGELARRYKTASAALQPAMLELQDLGLLAGEGSRVRVSEQDSWRLFAPSVFQELDQPRGREAIAAYMDARRCVDPTLCALAAERRGAADVISFRRQLDRSPAPERLPPGSTAASAHIRPATTVYAKRSPGRPGTDTWRPCRRGFTGTCATRNGPASRHSGAR